MKQTFWRRDWVVGLLISLVFIVFIASDGFDALERIAYDLGVRGSSSVPSERVAVIAIDDESLANIGRWPWSRDVHVQLIDRLAAAGAKVIAYTVFFLEPQRGAATERIEEISRFFAQSSLARDLAADIDQLERLSASLPVDKASGRAHPLRTFLEQSALVNRVRTDLSGLDQRIGSLKNTQGSDARLAQSIRRAGNVVLAMPFVLGEPRGRPDAYLPDYVTRNRVVAAGLPGSQKAYPAVSALPPLSEFGTAAAGIGHLNSNLDADGGLRRDLLVLDYYGELIPSVSLVVSALSLNLSTADISVRLGEGIQLGKLYAKTNPRQELHSFFYTGEAGRPAFQVDSFYDVISGKLSADKYANKIVLVGTTATGIGDDFVTPIDSDMSPVVNLAHRISSLLNEDFFVVPDWAIWARWGAFIIIALYLMLLLPQLRAGLAALFTVVLFIALLGTEYRLMTTQAIWIPLVVPASLLLVGHILLTSKRFLVTEKGKLRADAESSESNRMLGLSMQEQGQLDTAFEKFRKCPLDASILEVMYNLALDYERKRQFSKAISVYQYMADHDPKFRDIQERRDRARSMEQTVMLGSRSGGPGNTLILDGSEGMPKPMLGRYEVDKELGKGAMGIVYLGRDPKINRVVAIKTMDLMREFDAGELDDVKQRFFREAQAAGRLRHPNIVTIYDAGEEQDLAFIAMEFLSGKDLTHYTKPHNLLPLADALSVILHAAEALDYAHSQNVVHRDIKPANIMYDAEAKTLKITDFGIARITDSSKTKTGTVMGTPSYMSPEQLAGRKVDGRSDLFSLGVMLFQMVTGQLPFQADSLTNLMYKIANEDPPDVLLVRPDLAQSGVCLRDVIGKAMRKKADKRYQSGAEFARDLRPCAQSLVAETV